VAGADGIDPRGLQDLQLALGGATIYRRSESPQVVMQAHAVKLHPPAIQGEPFRFVKGDAANSKWGQVTVADALTLHHLALQGVEVGVIDIPKLWPRQRQAGRDGLVVFGSNGDPLATLARGFFARHRG